MKAFLRRLAQSTPLQPLWRGLLRLSVRGLRPGVPADRLAALMAEQNILLSKLGFGWGAHVESSGEAGALERAAPLMDPAPVLFDVGANQGSFARLFLSRFPEARLWCFEPAAATFGLLRKNLSDVAAARLLPY